MGLSFERAAIIVGFLRHSASTNKCNSHLKANVISPEARKFSPVCTLPARQLSKWRFHMIKIIDSLSLVCRQICLVQLGVNYGSFEVSWWWLWMALCSDECGMAGCIAGRIFTLPVHLLFSFSPSSSPFHQGAITQKILL